MVFLFSVVMLIFLVSACGKTSVNPEISVAEEIIETTPDSVLLMLERLTPQSLKNEHSKARYSLLYNYALYKNNYKLTNDSSLKVAYDYFSNYPDSKEYMITLFLEAEIAYNNGNMQQSMEYINQSSEIANKLGDDYWLAKVYEMTADLFSSYCNLTEEAKYAKLAADHFKMAGRELHHRYLMAQYADALFETGECERSIVLLDSIREIALRQPTDSSLYLYVLKMQFNRLINYDPDSITIKRFEEVEGICGEESFSPKELSIAATAYIGIGNEKKALRLLNIARGKANERDITEMASIQSTMSYLYSRKKDYYNSYLYLDSAYRYFDKDMRQLLTESMIVSQRDFQEQKAEKETIRAERLRLWLIAGSILAFILIVSGYIIYKYRLRNKRLEFEVKAQSLQNDLQNMQSRIVSLEAEKKTLTEDSAKQLEELRSNRTEIETLFKQTWSGLNLLCGHLIALDGEEVPPKMLHHNLNLELKKLLKPEKMKQIEETIDYYMDGLVTKLRNRFPKLKENDLRILYLSMAGFSARSISLLTGIKEKTVYQKRTRLMSKVNQ